MRYGIAMAAALMAIVLVACGSQSPGEAQANVEQDAQLDQINAATPTDAGPRYLMPTPGSDNGKPSADEPRYGRALDAKPQPRKQQ